MLFEPTRRRVVNLVAQCSLGCGCGWRRACVPPKPHCSKLLVPVNDCVLVLAMNKMIDAIHYLLQECKKDDDKVKVKQ